MVPRIWVMFVLAVAVSAPGGSLADELPARRPGLWEIVDDAANPLGPARTARVCIDAATEPLLNNVNAITRKSHCSETKAKTSGNVLRLETICDFRNTRAITRAAITIADVESFHIEAQSAYAPPLFGQREATRKQDGKWIGACPQDMRPGDIVADDAPKRNLVDAAEFLPNN
ncbi:DUF3617 domain-containing protein [Methylocapsa acidiphila]|uniref:DUF3617 domain-containing protein n=1 Tax=Methylocapsa acidiphila TaxID=133552 RepID=UPI0003FF4179|nr:DUF3617 family protein [Methylocapsa acidiphila]